MQHCLKFNDEEITKIVSAGAKKLIPRGSTIKSVERTNTDEWTIIAEAEMPAARRAPKKAEVRKVNAATGS